MKKTIFALMALTIAFATLFTTCKKDETEKTPGEVTTDFLTKAKKGWELTAAIADRAYTNKDGVTSENLLESYFVDCEKKDILFFEESGHKIEYGKPLCSWRSGAGESLGQWKLINNDKVLQFHLPYFVYGENDDYTPLQGTIQSIDEKQFIVTVPIDFGDEDGAAKIGKARNDRGIKVRGEDIYKITFTYRAK
jgi:hypothetical protein